MKLALCSIAIVGALGLALVIPSIVLGQEGPKGVHARIAEFMHGSHGMAVEDELAELGVTPQQKQQVAMILSANLDPMQARVDAVLDAREQQFAAIHATQYDEATIRQACEGVAAAETDLAVAAGRLIQDLRGAFTPEQSAKLAERHPRLCSMIREHLPKFRERLSAWIEKNRGV